MSPDETTCESYADLCLACVSNKWFSKDGSVFPAIRDGLDRLRKAMGQSRPSFGIIIRLDDTTIDASLVGPNHVVDLTKPGGWSSLQAVIQTSLGLGEHKECDADDSRQLRR